MSKTLGTSTPLAAPPATRVTRPGWRDPRLWIGVALVAACVVAGARLLASADDTVRVWAVADDEAAGVTLTEDDLVTAQVRFDDTSELDGYYRVSDELPDPMELLHGVGAGDLLPRSAVGSAGDSGLAQVPLTVDPGQVPPSVAAGSVVDVYLSSPGADREVGEVGEVGEAGRGGDGSEGLVLDDVTVVSDVPPDESFSADGLEQLSVAVPEDDVAGFFAAIRRQDSATLTVVSTTP